jgi:hypothetical protein
VISSVRDYYDAKVRAHGPTPSGVDWNGEQSQQLRFEALSRIISHEKNVPFSVDDYGCGYGAYVDYLASQHFEAVDYMGLDVAPQMIKEARRNHPGHNFVLGSSSPRVADYAVASGIFNVALQADRSAWQGYILKTLDEMNVRSTAGFAFNCLTSHAEPDKMRPHLFYGDPCFFFLHCKRSYSKQVALLHDYGLFEFTILVRKSR